MKEKTQTSNKIKINKSQLMVKIMAGVLAALMLVSACATCIYYFCS